jgi:hypothetical protein
MANIQKMQGTAKKSANTFNEFNTPATGGSFAEFTTPVELSQNELCADTDLVYLKGVCTGFSMFTSRVTGRDIVLLHFVDGVNLNSKEPVGAFSLMQVVPESRQQLVQFLSPIIRQMGCKTVPEAAKGSNNQIYVRLERNEQNPEFVNWKATSEVISECQILENK